MHTCRTPVFSSGPIADVGCCDSAPALSDISSTTANYPPHPLTLTIHHPSLFYRVPLSILLQDIRVPPIASEGTLLRSSQIATMDESASTSSRRTWVTASLSYTTSLGKRGLYSKLTPRVDHL